MKKLDATNFKNINLKKYANAVLQKIFIKKQGGFLIWEKLKE